MAVMRNFEAEAAAAVRAARGDLSHLFHHDESHLAEHAAAARGNQAPATRPATMAESAAPAPTKENPMSLLDTIKNGVAEAEAKLEGLDEEALTLLKLVNANPETAVIMRDLGALASVAGIPQGFITGTGNALKVLLAAYAPDPSPTGQQAVQQQPAPAQ